MTFCQIVLRIVLRRRKTFPLIVHQSSDCLQMMKSSGSQPSQLHGVNIPHSHGEVGGRGEVGRALLEPRVSSSHVDPHTAWHPEDRVQPSALCPEKQYYQCLALLSHSCCFPVQEEQVDSDTIYNSLWEDCRRLLKTGTTDLLFPFHLQEYIHKR